MANFYEGKHVIVCGGAGFIGGDLVEELLLAGARVTVLDDLSRGGRYTKGAQFFKADVSSINTCMFFFKKDVDVVFNLAARVAGVLHNQNHHLEMYSENIKVLTAPVIAASEVGIKHFLQTSSVCVYSPEYNHPSVEASGMMGVPHPANAGYAEAKRDGERVAEWANGIEHTVIVRPSNVYGPHDYFDDRAHVVPALIKKALYDEEIVVYGPMETVRELIYNRDVARGMMVAMARGSDKGIYNIGTGGKTAVRIEQLVDLITVLIHKVKPDYKPGNIVNLRGRGGGDPLRWSDASKLMSLGWSPTVDITTGLEATIRWYIDQELQDTGGDQ